MNRLTAPSEEDQMRNHRLKNFVAKLVEPMEGAGLFEGEKVLRVTHNGRQETGVVALAPHEARIVYDLLRKEFGFND
ncbi:TPA: hypothetical protein ACYLN4_007271 [Burkholderia lata]